jgi:hypothetical protein
MKRATKRVLSGNNLNSHLCVRRPYHPWWSIALVVGFQWSPAATCRSNESPAITTYNHNFSPCNTALASGVYDK